MPIRHDSAIDNYSLRVINEVEQLSTRQVSLGEVNEINLGGKELNIHQSSASQISVSQVGSGQVGTLQIGTFKNNTSKISLAQVSTAQSSFSQPRSTQISPAQIGLIQVSPHQVGSNQVGLTQIDSRDLDINQFNFSQADTAEVSLPSSITLQQVLSSHNYNSQNTMVPTWLPFLQDSTPFNLNIEITDLPTGQLAVACWR